MIGSGLASNFAACVFLSRDRHVPRRRVSVLGLRRFSAPLAEAIFTLKVLYADSDSELTDVIIPRFISSSLGFVVFGLIESVVYQTNDGTPLAPYLHPDNINFTVANAAELIGYGILALAIILTVRAYVAVIGFVRLFFEKGKMVYWLKPTLGAAIAGAIGLLYST